MEYRRRIVKKGDASATLPKRWFVAFFLFFLLIVLAMFLFVSPLLIDGNAAMSESIKKPVPKLQNMTTMEWTYEAEIKALDTLAQQQMVKIGATAATIAFFGLGILLFTLRSTVLASTTTRELLNVGQTKADWELTAYLRLEANIKHITGSEFSIQISIHNDGKTPCWIKGGRLILMAGNDPTTSGFDPASASGLKPSLIETGGRFVIIELTAPTCVINPQKKIIVERDIRKKTDIKIALLHQHSLRYHVSFNDYVSVKPKNEIDNAITYSARFVKGELRCSETHLRRVLNSPARFSEVKFIPHKTDGGKDVRKTLLDRKAIKTPIFGKYNKIPIEWFIIFIAVTSVSLLLIIVINFVS